MNTAIVIKLILFAILITAFIKFRKNKTTTKPIAPKINASDIPKYSTLMEEEQFWALIQNSQNNSNDQDAQASFLVTELKKLPHNEIIGFRLTIDKLLYDSYNSNLWCAAYIINGGCSDDGFEYFRCWLISKGKEIFTQTLKNPDFLSEVVSTEIDDYEFESLWYVALTAFEEVTGLNLYDFIDYENFKTCEGNYPTIEFTWKEDQPETMRSICPKLYEMDL